MREVIIGGRRAAPEELRALVEEVKATRRSELLVQEERRRAAEAAYEAERAAAFARDLARVLAVRRAGWLAQFPHAVESCGRWNQCPLVEVLFDLDGIGHLPVALLLAFTGGAVLFRWEAVSDATANEVLDWRVHGIRDVNSQAPETYAHLADALIAAERPRPRPAADPAVVADAIAGAVGEGGGL